MPSTDFYAQVRFSSSIFPPLQVLICISRLFWEIFGQWSGGTMEGRVVIHFDFFNAGGGRRFFFWFLLEERGGKRGDFVTIEMGSCQWCGGVHIVSKDK